MKTSVMRPAAPFSLPTFDNNINTIEPELDRLLQSQLAIIDTLLKTNTTYTWENWMQPMENLSDTLHQFWSPIQHMNAVVNSSELRKTIHACLPKLSDYNTAISQNENIYHAVQLIKDSSTFQTFTPAQQKTIEHELRDFKLSGVTLPSEQKKQFAALTKALSQLTQQFEENVLDATMGWHLHITDKTQLTGIPEHAKNNAKKTAEKKQMDGWVFTLETPDYLAIMMYADHQQLRKVIYEAYVTRASDCGPNATRWDNSSIMRDIMGKRFSLAQLLGFDNFVEYSLATKMVKKPEEVFDFLNTLAEKAKPQAIQEFQTLIEFARKHLGLSTLQAWDIAYASEKLRQDAYAISQEDLRPYFSEPSVMNGLFDIIHALYDVTFEHFDAASVWHPDATCYNVYDQNHALIARVFFDLYARENKRGGAWMDDCRVRRRLDNGDIQIPVAYVTCNFNGPIGNNPALFTHDEVVTLFHECGHALQHILTKINVASVSGINGIPWDAVEVASQFFENWAWEKVSVQRFAKHYQTGETLPDYLFDRMDRAKNFQSAMQMMRQLEFALFDFQLHMHYDKNDPNCIQTILDNIRQRISVVPVPNFNRFQHSFSHIFAGGYAAGYYSYKWAEVMACDAFDLFRKNGLFDKATAKKFQETFLESGGAIEPMDCFIQFRGRKPTVDALLKQSGIN